MKRAKFYQNSLPHGELTGELHEIYYCVGKYPLHKLVPSGYLGSPGFAEDGTFVRGDEGKHVSVEAGVRYDFSKKEWYCYIQIHDADDMYYDYMAPFTVEEWRKAVALYNSLYVVDTELLSEFKA